jgi:NADPH:quinone reductase
MKALLCRTLGPPEALTIETVDRPTAGPGEAVIRVRAAGLNFFDTLIIAGKYQYKPELPFSPGAEASGTDIQVGAGVTRLSVGDRVMAIGHGDGGLSHPSLTNRASTSAVGPTSSSPCGTRAAATCC